MEKHGWNFKKTTRLKTNLENLLSIQISHAHHCAAMQENTIVCTLAVVSQ